jgi:hypothetical protein
MAFCNEPYAATTAAALVLIDVIDDELGLAPAARMADSTSLSDVRICWIWGPNCDWADDWNSFKLVWMLSIAVCTPERPLATLSDPNACTDVLSLFAAAQYAGVPLLAPPLAGPVGLAPLVAVLALAVGLAVEPPLLEQPVTSIPTSAPTSARAANRVADRSRRPQCPGRAGRSSVRDCSAPPMGHSYRRCGGRRRGLPESPTRLARAAVASRSAVGGPAEIGLRTMRPTHHFCHVGHRDGRRD